MKTKVIFFISLIMMVSVSQAKGVEDANWVLDNSQRAMVHKKLLSIKNWSQSVKITAVGMGLEGTSLTLSEGAKVYNKVMLAGMTMEQGYDGKKAWSKDLQFGTRELSDQEGFSVIMSSVEKEKFPRKFFDKISLAPEQVIAGENCFVIRYSKKGQEDIYVSYSKKTYLPKDVKMKTVTAMGAIDVVVSFEKYKEHEKGFIYASEIVMQQAGMKLVSKIIDFKVNQKIDKKLFKKPRN